MARLQATSMATLLMVVVAAFLCGPGMVAPAEGRALLGLHNFIDRLKAHCPPPPSDPVPAPYTPDPSSYYPTPPVAVDPPYGSSPSQEEYDPSPDYQATPPAGGY